MASPTDTNSPAIVEFDVAIGEALFASTLATVILTNLVASGRLSHREADALLDGATLVLESNRGASADNVAAIDYALVRLTNIAQLLGQLRDAASLNGAHPRTEDTNRSV